jgi:imidazolonepropionase-like amidohydrolase
MTRTPSCARGPGRRLDRGLGPELGPGPGRGTGRGTGGPRGRRMLPAALVLLLAGTAAERIEAQYDTSPPPSAWVLQEVTVVHGDGRQEPGMTLIVRRGIIEALAPDAPVPPDARPVHWAEGTLYVYPGFIDGEGSAPLRFSPPDRDGIEGWNPTRAVQNFTAHRRAADRLRAGGDALRGHRRAGFIASQIFPGRGPIPGQTTLIQHRIEARTPMEVVLEPSLGLALSFQGAQGVYPGTLMAVHALIRQAFLDAGHHGLVRQAWERDPRGMQAPGWDPDFEVLRDAAAGEFPVYFRASGADDARRVLALADEIGFRPVIVGGSGIGELADELARRDVAVLLTTSVPAPNNWDPDDEEALSPAAARERDRLLPQYRTAALLHEAGVRFGLTSGGSGDDSPLEGARRYIEYGLSEEAALRALTLTPAELLGVPYLVRIEPGMAANFVVTDRPLFHEDAGIVWTFVEGRAERGRDPRRERNR